MKKEKSKDEKIKKEKKPFNFKKMFLIIFIVFVAISLILLYGRFIGTAGLMVKEYNISSQELPDGFNGTKIVHISDIHYERTTNLSDLKKIVDKINYLKPDIVVLTGDLFDKALDNNQKEELMIELKKIEVTIGKYAIKGNHDTDKDWEYIISESGFINLNNSYDIIYNNGYDPILLAGFDSIESSKDVKKDLNKVHTYKNEFVDKVSEPKYKILLMHQPDYVDEFDYSEFNLILAGHSHNGQVRIPIVGALYLPKGSKKYYDEYYKLNNTDLYISSGIGTSKINLRLFNKPSINFYRLSK